MKNKLNSQNSYMLLKKIKKKKKWRQNLPEQQNSLTLKITSVYSWKMNVCQLYFSIPWSSDSVSSFLNLWIQIKDK